MFLLLRPVRKAQGDTHIHAAAPRARTKQISFILKRIK